jgi:hypothetical protein
MTRFSARVARLPLRVRLVAGFSAAMLFVLAAAAAFVYWRVAFALDRQVNEDLNDVSRRIAPFVTPTGPLAKDAPAASTEAYQGARGPGKVLAYSPSLGARPLSDQPWRGGIVETRTRGHRQALPISNHPLRAYATRLPTRTVSKPPFLSSPCAVTIVTRALLELLVQLAVAGFGPCW